MLRPMRELVIRRPRALGRTALFFLSFATIACASLGYEMLEWLVAAVVDPSAGTAYLGTQGDVWDAQKDSACASAGALIATAIDGWQLRAETRTAE